MCGIIGIITTNKRNLVPELVSSLRNLEYRGYDSTGIAVVSDGTVRRVRYVGAPSDVLTDQEVARQLDVIDKNYSIGIGHNRWATHGKPSEQNAHPHVDCSGKIAVVHNGTILNYEALKKELSKNGHIFTSHTDTEVVGHLIEEEIIAGRSFLDAFLATIAQLEGSFGLAVCSADDPARLLVGKRGSPLSLGITKDSIIVTSSPNAALAYTNTFITLEEGDFAELVAGDNGTEYRIGNFLNDNPCNREPKIIEGVSLNDISKGTHESFMHKEIFEQSSAFRATILGRYDEKTGDAVLGGLIDHEDTLRNARGVLTIACGTAHNAASVGGFLIEALAGIPVRNEIGSEFRHKKIPLDPREVVLFAVSQSGETADSLESIKEAKRKGYKIFGIVNVVGSSIAEIVDAGVYTRAGAEIGVASTKAFTSQLAVFYLLALKLARERGMTPEEGQVFLTELEQIPELMKQALAQTEDIVRITAEYYVKKNIRVINFLGRGIHVPICTEASLKFKELTYIESGSYPLGELKHGPIAVIDSQALSVIIMPKDELFALSKNSIEQIRSKGGNVLIITDEEGACDLANSNLDVITIPSLKNSLFYPALEIIPIQLFAYYYAKTLGNNVDKPRNLAKSVTVE